MIEGRHRGVLACGNLAHGFAACSTDDKANLTGDKKDNIAIVSAYNDMLSAHEPYQHFPKLIKDAAREAGGVAQFAGGVPAMCDGVTQGQPGMELSLFSRDVIAMSTAIALSHNMFDVIAIADKRGMAGYTQEPKMVDDKLVWVEGPEVSLDPEVISTVKKPFSKGGGLHLMQGNLGRGMSKISAVAPEHRVVEAPAMVFDYQDDVVAAFKRGDLNKDVIVVLCFQGPKSNGMPELHKLTPP
ncbi:UNVERIFIED_CONTAM: hypothetical protein GTU68_026831, partial [Idotea baltica]|nr:hypothetical protein [Idotea baltica]